MSTPREVKLKKYNELLARAKTLVAGDDEGLEELIAAAVNARLSDTQIDSLLAVAGRTTKIKAQAAKTLAHRAKEELKRRDDGSPKAKADKKAAEAAARTVREAEIAALYERVKDIAKSPTVLADMQRVAHRLGVVSEDRPIASTYLACSSRLLKHRAISYLRRGAAASGKNHSLNTVLKLFPESCVLSISSATPQALIYYRGAKSAGDDAGGDDAGDENALAHKILVIAEAAILSRKANGDEHPMTGMLRVLLSDGRLDHLIPLPSNTGGQPETVHVKRNGPVVLLLTSAREDIEPEMSTRLLSSDADESSEQTRKVIGHILIPVADPVGEDELAKWVDFQRWLECDAPYEVVIPFRQSILDAYLELIDLFPAALQLRMRRDASALVAAVEASAVMHKAQRQVDAQGCIVAQLEDYANAQDAFDEGMAALYDIKRAGAIAAALAAAIEVAGDQAKKVSPYRRQESESYKISVEHLRRKLGVASKSTAQNRIEKLVDLGALEEDGDKRGKGRSAPCFYWIRKESLDVAEGNVFPTVEHVRRIIDREGAPYAGTDRTGEKIVAAQELTRSTSETPLDGRKVELGTLRPSEGFSADERVSHYKQKIFSPVRSVRGHGSPFPHRNGAEEPGNARKSSDLTAAEHIAAAHEAGGVLTLWPDGVDFEVDLRGVADPVIRNVLLDAVNANHAVILEELKRERAKAQL